MTEHGVVVVFDVTAPGHDLAARYMAGLLKRRVNPYFGIQSSLQNPDLVQLESWWFPEAEDKHIDGNDNDDMLLVSRDLIRGIVGCYEQGDPHMLGSLIEQLPQDE